MTSTTWNVSHTTFKSPELANVGLRVLREMGHFVAVCLGAYAEQDSNFRGLDLNGNAIWSRSDSR